MSIIAAWMLSESDQKQDVSRGKCKVLFYSKIIFT